MASTDINTLTITDRDRLIGGDNTDWLLAQLLNMARYDMQDAHLEIDQAQTQITIVQQPHQGDERRTVAYGPIEDVVAEWLDSEEQRTGRTDIYDLEPSQVELIRETIEEERNA